jgi:acetyltransferase-like isoleucine patch superfamily enzyme
MLLPARAARILLNGTKFRIDKSAKIGLSWIEIERLSLGAGARIGHFNVLRIRALEADQQSYLSHLNRLVGPYSIRLAAQAGIGNRNQIVRSPANSDTDAVLSLGTWAKVTSGHYLDMTSSISVGDYSTIAGFGCQLWTHGYIHAERGLDRYRIDGSIEIGSNVYIGTMCFISMGVSIVDGAIVGGGTSVAKDLSQPCLYVSSPIRCLPRPPDPASRGDLERVPSQSGDIVYRKADANGRSTRL